MIDLGEVIDRLREEYLPSNSVMIYCGDGKNDYCSCLHSKSDDLIFVRKGFPLEKLLEEKSPSIRSKILFFQTFDQIDRCLTEMNIL